MIQGPDTNLKYLSQAQKKRVLKLYGTLSLEEKQKLGLPCTNEFLLEQYHEVAVENLSINNSKFARAEEELPTNNLLAKAKRAKTKIERCFR